MKRVHGSLAAALLACAVVAGCGGSSTPAVAPTGSSSATAPATGSPVPTPAATYTAPPDTLPLFPVDLRTTAPPWQPPALLNNGADSARYVEAAGFRPAPENLKVHYHAHLDIVVNGKAVPVVPYIGVVAEGNKETGLSPLHTHDDSGILHVESPTDADFLLGQLFIEWGVRFTPTCLGPYCSGSGKELAVFVNGQKYDGDPTRLVLKSHQEIAIEYGDAGQLPTPPSSYDFPSGD